MLYEWQVKNTKSKGVHSFCYIDGRRCCSRRLWKVRIIFKIFLRFFNFCELEIVCHHYYTVAKADERTNILRCNPKPRCFRGFSRLASGRYKGFEKIAKLWHTIKLSRRDQFFSFLYKYYSIVHRIYFLRFICSSWWLMGKNEFFFPLEK